jgi:photosystem II stability/assembly factor-like uncharacterized protein
MATPRHVEVNDGDVLVLVGTMKGAFLMRSSGARARWEAGGPYFPGQAVYAMAYDGRAGRRRLWAGTGSMHWGAVLRSSDDLGKTWTNPEEANVRFPADSGVSLRQIWQIRPGRPEEPDTLYCGVEPAALFESRDAGATWTLNRGLFDHPHRPQWQPGGGGLCLHTIVPDAADRRRMLVAISTGGVYRTDDGGRTWAPRNQGVRAEFLPDRYPEWGQCVHKVVQHPARPERLFLQNHWGLYRSDDGGDSWKDIARGVPSDFGFAMAIHPHDPDTVYIVPIESDEFRCTPEGRLRVYRTRDAGGAWEPLTRGLPQKDALETVLRDALATDPLNPAGVYFGTRSGQLWGSPDGGASWSLIRSGLPPVVCVRAAVVGDVAKARVPAARTSARATARKPAARKPAARRAAPAKRTTRGRRATPRRAAARKKR